MGGAPLALTRAAAPFESGRVIGLFSHKKFDTVTLEYVDANGGLHGAIFLLSRGQGQILRTELEANGLPVTHIENDSTKAGAQEGK